MTPEQFCFWLHGFFELTGRDELTPEQACMVREHLDLVFSKVTPELRKKKDDLQELLKPYQPSPHDGGKRIC